MSESKKSLERRLTRKEFINRFLKVYSWIPSDGPSDLSGLYTGKSERIHDLIKEAFHRGARRGIGIVWSGRQELRID